jgi:hypothetical protein
MKTRAARIRKYVLSAIIGVLPLAGCEGAPWQPGEFAPINALQTLLAAPSGKGGNASVPLGGATNERPKCKTSCQHLW